MPQNTIVGRVDEIEVLSKAFTSNSPEFIAIYGRRRIGKTFLIKEFFKDSICFELIGIHKASLSVQLSNFAYSLKDSMGIAILPQTPKTWMEAFSNLEQFFGNLRDKKKGKKVIFIDELPWLNTPRSNFLSALEHFWNSYGSKQSNLILVICGSAASWMIQKIIKSRGGLHNRLTRQIRLMPFTLQETELFLKSRGVILTRYQTILLYMAMGGVPFYLAQAEAGLSAAQIIDRICFSRNGLLRNEFDNLFASLFDRIDQHIRIVEVLRQNLSGMKRNQLLSLVKIPSGGSASKLLEELEESGFIESRIPFGKSSNEALYRISDEFTLFYFDWIKPLGKKEVGSGYWLSLQNDPKRRAWSGYAFEGICMKHFQKIKNSLGIEMVETFHGPWSYAGSKETGVSGTQIDLLIDRRDATINLCEIKFSESEFVIDSAYVNNLRQKVEVFRMISKTKKNIFVTMITTFGISNNSHANDIVTNSLTMDSLF